MGDPAMKPFAQSLKPGLAGLAVIVAAMAAGILWPAADRASGNGALLASEGLSDHGAEPAAGEAKDAVPGPARLWLREWPNTDFNRHSVDLVEIQDGGPPRDGIPSIDDPLFVPVSEARGLTETEPLISLEIAGDARAYPLSILMWHEIVNDVVGGVPVAVTYCPLCNASVVFEREFEGRLLDFGTTGKLRLSDLVMYDRQTESWWQQFTGEAIVGAMTGQMLARRPARMESFSRFKARFPEGKVLIPNNPHMRDYGANPYRGYDTLSRPWLYDGRLPEGIEPMARVVTIGHQAWSLRLLREKGRIEHDGYVMTWEPGQNSALDSPVIARGRDVGNVVVQKRTPDGLVDAVHGIDFAFAFHAFFPDGVIHTR